MQSENKWKQQMKREKLSRQEDHSKDYRKDDTLEGEGSPLLKIIATAGILSAGIIGYRKGLFKEPSKKLLELADSYGKRSNNLAPTMKAFNKWANASVYETKYTSSLLRARPKLSELTQKEGLQTILSDTKGDVLEFVSKRKSSIEYLEKSKKLGTKTYYDTELVKELKTMNSIVEQLEKEQNGINIGHTARTLMSENLYSSLKITEEKAKKQIATNGYKNLTLDDIVRVVSNKDGTRKVINKRTDFILDETSTSLIDDFLKGTMVGYQDDAGRSVKGALINSNKWKDFKVDAGLRISEEGRIIDTRYANKNSSEFLRSLSNDYKVPLLNFNPLKFFGLDKVGYKKSRFGIIHQSTVQNVLTNLPGRKTLKETGKFGDKALLFVDGDVFKFGDTKAANAEKIASNLIAEKIPTNLKRSGGLRSDLNYYRKMVGLNTKEFEVYGKEDGFLKEAYSNIAKKLDIGFQDRDIQRYGKKVITTPTGVQKEVTVSTNDGLFDVDNMRESMYDWIKRKVPSPAKDVKEKVQVTQLFGNVGKDQDLYLLRHKDTRVKDVINNKDVDTISQYFREIFAGRNDIKNISGKGTFVYSLADRLNQTLSNVGLGLGMDSIGSTTDTLSNLVLKRFLPIYGAYQTMQYVTYLSERDNQNRGNIQKDIAEAFKVVDLGFHKVKDISGITSFTKGLTEIMPGSDSITDLPGVSGLALEQSYEERKKYYESGMVAVRKGRYWELGNSPFVGGKVQYWKPNLYRRIKGDVMFTDSKYGSRKEYFDNAWFSSPIKHFVTDKYHYEKKHYYDRPYPVTSPEFANVPIVGDILSGTVGKIVKPQRIMHPEYFKSQSNLENGSGDFMKDLEINNRIPTNLSSGDTAFSDTIQNINGSSINITSSNSNRSEGLQPILYTTSSGQSQIYSVDKGTNLNNLRWNLRENSINNIDGALPFNPNQKEEDVILNDVNVPGNLKTTLASQYTNLTNLTGMTGYITESFLTGTPMKNAKMLDNASYAMGFNKTFWDQEIGGIGGELSEIFRRFIPDKNKDFEYINPIKNNMPSWMPGCFVKGTKVFTDKGFIDIDKLCTNDKVYSYNSDIKTIEWVNKDMYKGDFVEIKATGVANKIKATGNHPFYIIKSNECPYYKNKKRMCIPGVHPSNNKPCKYCKSVQYSDFMWDEARNLKIGDYLAISIPKREESIDTIEIPSSNRKMRNDISGKKILLDFDFGTFVGFYLSEGFSNEYAIYLASGINEVSQRNSVDRLCELLNIKCTHKEVYDENGKGCVTTLIHNAQLARYMTREFGNYAKNKNLPNWIYSSPKEFQFGLFAGYIEGDGSVGSDNRITASSLSYSLINGLMLLLAQNNIISNINLKRSKNNKFSNKTQYTLNVQSLYSSDIKKSTKSYGRKLSKLSETKPKSTGNSSSIYKGYLLRKITDIKKYNSQDYVYNLQVSGNHTYNVEGVSVHNSEYFIDFTKGDPYTKVKWGEGRLPGEGYERLWDVEPFDMGIGSSFIGKSKEDIIKHLLYQDEITDQGLKDILDEGTAVHERMEKEMVASGDAKNIEQTIYDKEHGIKGTYDVFLSKDNQYTGREGIMDIKTTGDKQFKEIQRTGIPKAENVSQVNFYLHNLNMKHGSLLYVNRDNPEEQKVVEFDYSKELYESDMNKLEEARSDIMAGIESGEIKRGDLYSPMDRVRILADVAPYSNEYKEAVRLLRNKGLTEEKEEELRAIEERVREQKQPLKVYDYKFKTANLVEKKVEIDKVINNDTFTVKGEDDVAYTLGGISVKQPDTAQGKRDFDEYISSTLKEGNKITLKLDPDELKSKPSGINSSIKSIVEDDGKMINRELVKRGFASLKEDDDSPIGVNVRHSAFSRTFGSIWESFAHMDTYFNTKFLQVRSPLEHYKRNVVYGEDFQEWSRPVENFLKPTVNKLIERPAGLLIAPVIGSMFGRTKAAKLVGATIGLSTVLVGKTIAKTSEIATGDTWKPKTRRKEEQLDEYVDKLKYVKNMKLYNEYKTKALEEDGFDLDEYRATEDVKAQKRKARVRKLESAKKDINYQKTTVRKYVRENKEFKLTDEQKSQIREKENTSKKEVIKLAAKSFVKTKGLGNKLEVVKEGMSSLKEINSETSKREEKAMMKNINSQINEISTKRDIDILPENALRALEYYDMAEQTVYGYDPGDSIQNLMKAIPKNEKDFFRYFVDAPEEERGEILDLVPNYLKNAMMGMWGKHTTEKEPLVDYFSNHQLPGEEWVGWDENVNLDNVKVKLVKKENLETSNFNIWDDDIESASQQEIPIPHINKKYKKNQVHALLKKMLEESGYENIQIQSKSSLTDSINLNVKNDMKPYADKKIREEGIF